MTAGLGARDASVAAGAEVIVVAPFGISSDEEMANILAAAGVDVSRLRVIIPAGRSFGAAQRAGARIVQVPIDRNPLSALRHAGALRAALRPEGVERTLVWQGGGFVDPYLLFLGGGLAASGSPQPTLVRPGGTCEPIHFRPSTAAPAAWRSGRILARVLVAPRRIRELSVPRRSSRPVRRALYLRDDLPTILAGEVGGSATHMRGVIGGLMDSGIEVIAATPRPVQMLRRAAPEHIDISVPLPRNLHSELSEADIDHHVVARVLPQVVSRDVDLVYQRHSMFAAAGLELAHRLQVPLVLECNSSEPRFRATYGRVRFRRAAERFESALFTAASLVVVVSRRVADEVFQLAPEARVMVVPNGVDVELFGSDGHAADVERRALGISPGSILVGFFGRFYPWHGVETLAAALDRLMSTRREIHALFVGDGPSRDKAESTLARHADRVHFVGLVPHERVPALMSACDVLTAPHAPHEGFVGSPMKLFEYMASGRALVASRLEQLGEVVDDGHTGLLVTPGDEDELRAAIARLASDADLRRRLGEAAREAAVREHSWSVKMRSIVEAVA